MALEPKATTWLQQDFMRLLKRHGMMNYSIQPPAFEDDATILVGENAFPVNKMFTSRDEKTKVFKNVWNEELGKLIIMSVTTHNHQLVLPIIWEGSVLKLLAEFAALNYVVFDIPIMNSKDLVGEVLRRLQHYTNTKIEVNTTGEPDTARFTTPYKGFYHHHMRSFNSIVISALAVPNGIRVDLMAKEGTKVNFNDQIIRTIENSKGVQTLAALQWPYRIHHAYIFNGKNDALSFDMTKVHQANRSIYHPHVSWIREGRIHYPDSDIKIAQYATMLQRQFNGVRSELRQASEDVTKALEKLVLTAKIGIPKV